RKRRRREFSQSIIIDRGLQEGEIRKPWSVTELTLVASDKGPPFKQKPGQWTCKVPIQFDPAATGISASTQSARCPTGNVWVACFQTGFYSESTSFMRIMSCLNTNSMAS